MQASTPDQLSGARRLSLAGASASSAAGEALPATISRVSWYRFTHCPEAHANSTVDTETWRRSWDDLFTDDQAWEAAGAPAGYVWGVQYAAAYPGMSYVALSASARQWTEQLNRQMHEVRIETNAWVLRLVFHDLRVEQLAAGDPNTDALTELQ